MCQTIWEKHRNFLLGKCSLLKIKKQKNKSTVHVAFNMSKYSDAAAAKLLQSCPTLCDPTDGSPPGSPIPGFSRQEHWSGLPVGFLLQCMKVKSESEVAQSCPTLRDPMDCSLTRLLHPWDFPGKSTGVGC